MSDIAGLLKSEIIRLSKKVVREHVGPVQSQATQNRLQLSAMKKQIASLERDIAKLRRAASSASATAVSDEPSKIRFVAKGLVSLRARLGLSAHDFALLLGVSTQTIFNWESKKTTPRAEQVAAIAKLRGIGKREAIKRIEELSSATQATE